MELNSRDFSDTVQMELAILDIRRYQRAYMTVNNVKGIMVKYKRGWFMIKHGLIGCTFHRPTKFRNMIDVLEKRAKALGGK